MEKQSMLSQKSNSIQTLRAFAFLGIFLQHAGARIKWPNLGVSIFFVLSGFLLTLSYQSKPLFSNSSPNGICFSLNKIRKLYPLHFFTMCLCLLLDVVAIIRKWSLKRGLTVLLELLLNVPLLQSWFPNQVVNTSLNGVAWYLSVMAFLYAFYPTFFRIIHRNEEEKSIKKQMLIPIVIIIIQVFACFIWLNVSNNQSRQYIWFMYCFPVFRAGDFLIGCCFGEIISKIGTNEKNSSSIKTSVLYSLLEIAALVLTIGTFYLAKHNYGILYRALFNWTTIYIPLAVFWVLLFYYKHGIMTRLLTNRVTVYLGNISSFLFLIHYVITRYVSAVLIVINVSVDLYIKYIIIGTELIISILLSILYARIADRINNAWWKAFSNSIIYKKLSSLNTTHAKDHNRV